ncbi:hypothetical protein CHISP_2098 [Chitinispirillum alkaliphilum]|nr:hypothetical protein CHISP_2098 [Chitinispirillum alkaliphilum]
MNIISAKDDAEFARSLAYNDVDLIMVPFEKSRYYVEGGYLKSMGNSADSQRLRYLEKELLLSALGNIGGEQFYLPRNFKTRVMVYRRSKVQDALRVWRSLRHEINDDLRHINGYGLPSNYILEENPEEWDFFDLFVLGWIWSRQEYGGEKKPRIAHPVVSSRGLALRLIDHVKQFSSDQEVAVEDMFHWEALFSFSGVHNPAMWNENWTDQDLWEAFGNSDIFLSFLTQKDIFHIHGTGKDNLMGYVENGNDLAFATIPRAVSLELDHYGSPLRTGGKSIVTGGFWWAVPLSAQDPGLSLKFIEHVSGSVNQVEESSRFGIIPVRREVLSHIPIIAGDHWVTQLYTISFLQLKYNGKNFLNDDIYNEMISDKFISFWSDLVAEKNWADGQIPDRKFIQEKLTNIEF